MSYFLIIFSLLILSIQVVEAVNPNYAYVSMYYPYGELSKSDFVGIQTMYQSFTKMNSKAEFLVVAPKNMPSTDIEVLQKQGMKVYLIDIENAYKQKKIHPDYQKTKNILMLWELTNYKRVIFVDYYTVFVHNLDSLFDCSYLCVKDEQPLVYSNDMIVITPGHAETRKIFEDCISSEATFSQYALYNRYGYYSTELYEISQAAPVFDIGEKESTGHNIRRYLNFVNFPSVMWYEKMTWDLYSCSGLDPKEMPVYSINYRFTIGHKSMFLPTHWISYGYLFDLSNYWYDLRLQLKESFVMDCFLCIAITVVIIALSKLLVYGISTVVVTISRLSKRFMNKIHIQTALAKMLLSCYICALWVISIKLVPATLIRPLGYFFFETFFLLLLVISMLGFNKGTNVALGTKVSCGIQMKILILYGILMTVLFVFNLIDKLIIPIRLSSLILQFFIELYCLYSQLSPLFNENHISYSTLPE